MAPRARWVASSSSQQRALLPWVSVGQIGTTLERAARRTECVLWSACEVVEQHLEENVEGPPVDPAHTSSHSRADLRVARQLDEWTAAETLVRARRGGAVRVGEQKESWARGVDGAR